MSIPAIHKKNINYQEEDYHIGKRWGTGGRLRVKLNGSEQPSPPPQLQETARGVDLAGILKMNDREHRWGMGGWAHVGVEGWGWGVHYSGLFFVCLLFDVNR